MAGPVSIVYNYKTYYRAPKGTWYDKNYRTVTELQNVLDEEYTKNQDLTAFSAEELLKEADIFKENGSYGSAVRYYLRAYNLANGNQLFGLFSKLSSCYRNQGQPQKSIELFEEVKRTYGENLISDAFLTSVGAAYCDLTDYVEAKRFADRAYARAGGKASTELNGLYGRIRKETTGSGKFD